MSYKPSLRFRWWYLKYKVSRFFRESPPAILFLLSGNIDKIGRCCTCNGRPCGDWYVYAGNIDARDSTLVGAITLLRSRIKFEPQRKAFDEQQKQRPFQGSRWRRVEYKPIKIDRTKWGKECSLTDPMDNHDSSFLHKLEDYSFSGQDAEITQTPVAESLPPTEQPKP